MITELKRADLTSLLEWISVLPIPAENSDKLSLNISALCAGIEKAGGRYSQADGGYVRSSISYTDGVAEEHPAFAWFQITYLNSAGIEMKYPVEIVLSEAQERSMRLQ